MDLTAHFQMLARYNRVANERLFECCSQLSVEEYRKPRAGSFGSLHGLLNHILLGDRIWMSRFEGGGHVTPNLATVQFEELPALRAARAAMDARIEAFFEDVEPGFWVRALHYINNKGLPYVDTAPAAVAHFFNHQTHHRGQAHVMISQTTVAPPSLDMHRIIHP